MRIRIRGPTGQSTISLADTATVEDLLVQIEASTALTDFDLKYGYPPTPLSLAHLSRHTPIADIGVALDGEQLMVVGKDAAVAGAPPAQSAPDEPPEIASPEHGGTVVLRVMPDDNSCLFRAVGNAVLGAMDAVTELRSVVAQTIQDQPETYSPAVLERPRDEYCRWIQTADAWGGGIELSILSKHFDVEICSIDVQTLRVDRFNDGRPTRCIVVYSGIHYDGVALSPSAPPFTRAHAPPECDTRIFDTADAAVLERARALCRVLQQRHYYTDTAGFRVQCQACGGRFVGEQGAAAHAAATGHYDFGEAD
ncbi:ubiquitin-specific protease otu1 [Ophidiomyces ophidiicola]|uniref:ubiquitin-specific protease otu1 n=1 Tax=Ophidiomyces ophidiicola TaxID=1387563 RepID=UPI0020C2F909|nr:ubiquitin-specific protease otu1 [Ophidiomyces ophidiicola]KAI1943389.1 ubiquitin-specific protease otu1 [Ophidiomyces ophidiicola]KAI1953033.1 ubiquitin-specific protease otu1 [Ophidiomyces ophidiicola]KAI1962621.1 ubiquitin-specific protease otu1 [Ophidiomyces ophidiicola]KAI1973551.1 ubiquitin-specific protease otu1 [Ophidiomyces ophidiicola]KAI1975010.1 ubiquitin-specific protease otu1 [Ophidiomyces ophidiicola]